LLKYLKNLVKCRSENNFVGPQNNYVKYLNVDDNVAKDFNVLTIRWNVSHNYFDGPNKIIFRSESI